MYYDMTEFILQYDLENEAEVVGVTCDGVSLPYDPATKTFDEEAELVVKLREWEATRLAGQSLISWAYRDRTTEKLNTARSQIDDTSKYTKRFYGLEPQVDPENSQQWQVAPGAGQVLDQEGNTRFIYIEQPLILPIPSQLDGNSVTNVYGYFYWDGSAIAVAYQEQAPTSKDIKFKLFLGAIISSDGLTINSLRPISLADEPETQELLDRGAINLDGAVVSPIPGTLNFSFSGGDFKFAGRNAYSDINNPHLINLPAQSPINFVFCDDQGVVINSAEDFDFSRYMENGQVITTSLNSIATIHYLYLFPSGAIAAVLGTNHYEDLTAFKSESNFWENHRIPPKFKNNTYFLGAIAGLVGAVDSSDRDSVLILNKLNNY